MPDTVNLLNSMAMEARPPVDIGFFGADNSPFDFVRLGHDLPFLLWRWTKVCKLRSLEILQSIVVIVQLINDPLQGVKWCTVVDS